MIASVDSRNSAANFLKALDEAGFEAVVCGGVAAVYHGVERVTTDLDVSLNFATGSPEAFRRILKLFELTARIPEPPEAIFDASRRRAWIEEKKAVVLAFTSEDGRFVVDVFLNYVVPHDELAAEGHVVLDSKGTIMMSSIPHLIRAKRAVVPMRDKDIFDVRHLIRTLRERRKHADEFKD